MIEQAKLKNAYTDLHELMLSSEDPLQDFPHELRNQYDYVTAAGIINGNYMNANLFEELLMACKNRGYLIFAARFSYLGDYWYNEYLDTLEKEKRIKFIKSEEFFKYD